MSVLIQLEHCFWLNVLVIFKSCTKLTKRDILAHILQKIDQK